jgi:hypothetical protein
MARAAQMMCIRNSSDIPINLCQQPRDGEDVQYDGDDVPGHRDAPDNGNAPADETLNVDEIYEGWELALRWYIRISLPTMPISLATLPLKRPSKASTMDRSDWETFKTVCGSFNIAVTSLAEPEHLD